MQRTTRVDVTTSSTNHAVCTAHDHYCVIFFSKITTAKTHVSELSTMWPEPADSARHSV